MSRQSEAGPGDSRRVDAFGRRATPRRDACRAGGDGERRARGFRTLLRIGALAALAAGLGCSGDGVGLGESGERLPPGGGDGSGAISFSADIVPLFQTHCTRCHAPGGIGYLGTGGDASNGLDLTDAAARAGLVGVETFQAPGDAPRWRVRAGEPDSSYLLEKVVSDTPKSGAKMPLDGPPFLSAGETGRIERWIDEGAADN